MPGYGQLLRRGYGSLAAAARGCADCGWELSRRTWAENAHLRWGEVLLVAEELRSALSAPRRHANAQHALPARH